MSVLAFFGQHLREGGHHIEVQAVHFVVEALGIQGALRSENRHGVIDVLLFVRRDSGKGLAKTSRRYLRDAGIDRKSTRLNSSHTVISYAVFCLKKKKTTIDYIII